MRLYKLIGLELEALRKEHEETLKHIAQYQEILGSRGAMAKVIIRELDKFRKEYGRQRRTAIENAAEAVYEEKKMEEIPVVALTDRFGYAKAVDVPTYERNKEAADSESKYQIPCKNTDKLCIFTDTGQQHLVKVKDLPFGKFREKGTPLDNISNYNSGEERLIYMDSLSNLTGKTLLFASSSGMLKQVDGGEFDVSKRTTAATKLGDGDRLLAAALTEEKETIILQTNKGMFLRFLLSEVPQKKKGAVGVRGIRLSADDEVEAVYLLGEKEEKTITFKEKEIALHRLRIAGRDTKGVKK